LYSIYPVSLALTGKADFVIFDTDYRDYMAVFECDRAGLLHRRSVTILSRASVMDQMFVDRVSLLSFVRIHIIRPISSTAHKILRK